MPADIDGDPWDAEFTIFTSPSGHLIVDGTVIKLVIDNYTGVGSYNFIPSDFNSFARWQDTENSFFIYLAGSGVLEVTIDE